MVVFAIILTWLTMLVTATHVMRGGNLMLVGLCVVVMVLSLIRRAWAWWIVQLVLCLAAAEWLLTTHALVQHRLAGGRPYTRLAIILLSVTAVAIAAAALRGITRNRWLRRAALPTAESHP
jgi:hypothetical protein